MSIFPESPVNNQTTIDSKNRTYFYNQSNSTWYLSGNIELPIDPVVDSIHKFRGFDYNYSYNHDTWYKQDIEIKRHHVTASHGWSSSSFPVISGFNGNTTATIVSSSSYIDNSITEGEVVSAEYIYWGSTSYHHDFIFAIADIIHVPHRITIKPRVKLQYVFGGGGGVHNVNFDMDINPINSTITYSYSGTLSTSTQTKTLYTHAWTDIVWIGNLIENVGAGAGIKVMLTKDSKNRNAIAIAYIGSAESTNDGTGMYAYIWRTNANYKRQFV
jgi:hypothetical protein